MTVLSMLVAVVLHAPPDCKPDCVAQAALAETRIRVDGVLDEPVWEGAGQAGDFLQYAPDEGAPATLNTRVYLLHDARTLFIGATLEDPEPARIRRTLGRRDEFTPGDWFVASFDTYDDRKTSFNFAVNAAGVRVEGMGVDAMLPDGSGRPALFASEVFGFDPAWDVEWSGAARVDSGGWTVEMAIPLSALEIAHPGRGEVGVNFQRWAPRRGELSEWSLARSRERSHGSVAHFGRLRFEAKISPGVRRSITPFVNTFRVAVEDGDDLAGFPLPGVEWDVALRPSLALTGALSPDFAPEHADEYPGVIPLDIDNRFDVLRRPFAYPALFPAARHLIGSPHIVGGMLETTSEAPFMLGALALHGRLPRGLTFGVTGMATLASEDFTEIDQGYSARLLKDVGRLSKIGFTGALGPVFTNTVITEGDTTEVWRTIDTTTGVASVDWDFRFGDNSWRAAGQALLSREQDILVQTDSLRVRRISDSIYQYTLESSRLSNEALRPLPGFAARLDLEQLGRRWNWYGRVVAVDSGFRTGPSGMAGKTDRLLLSAGVHHTLAGGRLGRLARQGRISMQWTNEFAYADLGLQATRIESYASLLTRGHNEVFLSVAGGSGPSGVGRFGGAVEISSDMRRNWALRPHLWLELVEGGRLNWGASAQVTGRLRSRITASAQAGMDRYESASYESSNAVRSPGTDLLRLWPSWDYAIAWRRHVSSYVPGSFLYGPGRVEEGVRRELGEAYGRIRLAAGILRSLDVELGMGMSVLGYSAEADAGGGFERILQEELGAVVISESYPADAGGRFERILQGSRANFFGGVRWEYKQGSILAFSVMRASNPNRSASWDNAADLFALPFETGALSHVVYTLRISRKVWR